MNITFDLVNIYYFIAGFVIASVVFFFLINGTKKELKTLKRQFEKKSIGADDSDLKVKTLENKIKTLEAALKKQSEQ